MKTSAIAVSQRITEQPRKSVIRYIKEVSIPRVRLHCDTVAVTEAFGIASLLSISLFPLVLFTWWL